MSAFTFGLWKPHFFIHPTQATALPGCPEINLCPEEEATKESSLENKGQLGSPVQGLSPHPHTPISSTRLGLMEGLRVGPGHPDPGRGHPSVGVTETLELKNGNNNTLGPWCLAMPGATLATLGSH